MLGMDTHTLKRCPSEWPERRMSVRACVYSPCVVGNQHSHVQLLTLKASLRVALKELFTKATFLYSSSSGEHGDPEEKPG